MRIYTARPCWNDGWWTIIVDEVNELVARTRRLEQVPAAVTSCLMNLPGEPIDFPEDALVLVLPEIDMEPIRHLRQAHEQA